MDIDDSDIRTGASMGRVMTLGVVVGSVAGSRKELGGDEGGLIGRAGDGWRLVVGEARTTEGAGLEWGGLRLLLVGDWAVRHVMVGRWQCWGPGRG